MIKFNITELVMPNSSEDQATYIHMYFSNALQLAKVMYVHTYSISHLMSNFKQFYIHKFVHTYLYMHMYLEIEFKIICDPSPPLPKASNKDEPKEIKLI